MKNIYIEPAWKLPLSSQSLLQHPPDGYRFLASETSTERGVRFAAKLGFAYTAQEWLQKALPVWLLKSYLGKFRAAPGESVLTYAIVHPVFRREPWILDLQCEQPYLMLGGERHFKRYGGILKRAIGSEYCRGVLCAADAGRKAFVSIMGQELGTKVNVVYPAVPPRSFSKTFDRERIKLLFVNSGNINTSMHFDTKGGKEAVEAFRVLCKRYDNLELVIRSSISQEMKEKCLQTPNVRVIDHQIPWEELEREWQTADIFVLPTRVTPFMVYLDAMSYELPVVTSDIWGNPEFVQDGKTGYLVPESDGPKYIRDSVVLLNSPEYRQAVINTDHGMVRALVDRLSILIENAELRRQMGAAGRWEIEHGKFSFQARNDRLKRIFDEATAGGECKSI